MIVYKCDKCGKVFKNPDVTKPFSGIPVLKILAITDGISQEKDLCPNCQVDLRCWMIGLEETKGELSV